MDLSGGAREGEGGGGRGREGEGRERGRGEGERGGGRGERKNACRLTSLTFTILRSARYHYVDLKVFLGTNHNA